MILAVNINLSHGGAHALFGGYKDVGRENLEALHILGGQLCLTVKNLDTFYLVAPKDDPQHDILIAQEHIHRVALDTEGAHPQVGITA